MLNQKKLLIIIFTVSLGLSLSIQNSSQHGLGFEILPPVMLGDKQVALEVTSSAQNLDPQSADRQVTLTLFETATKITIRDVTYHITASKGSDFLFENTFKSDNGIFTMNLIPTESGSVEIVEESEGSFFDSLLGMQKDVISIKGPDFRSGGLYNFEVEILTAESYSNELEEPILYNVGLSIPDRTYYDIEDANFGNQEVSLITYYDTIENFQYDQKSSSISFSMPFVWTFDNINQTSVVHEELIISKTFGDLMVEHLSAFVNGVKLPDHVITLDGFSEHTRIIHVVVNQNDLFDLFKVQENPTNMDFLIKPSSDNLPLETITGNGQFKIKLNWEPRDAKSGSDLILYFDIKDVFFKDKPISVSYDLSVLHAGNEIFSTSGISTDSRDEHNVVEFSIPVNVNGPITIQFDNLNENSLARVGLPIVVNRIDESSMESDVSIPDWVRSNAEWWYDGTITDNDFASGIEFMIQEEIIKVPPTSGQVSENTTIPDWVRNNAKWWSERLISDEEFANGLQYLIKNGIISV
jgi:hypothetical protein